MIAYLYDHSDIRIVLSGSEVGLLYRFIGINDPYSPLYGRPYDEIRLNPLDRDRSRDFLEKGFEQLNIDITDEELDIAVEKLDGVIGWLTYYGYLRWREKADIEEIVNRASRLAIEELKNLLKQYSPGEKRYIEVMKVVANLGRASWSEIKRGVESKMGKIPNNTLSKIIRNLVDSGVLIKKMDGYEVGDPLLRRGILGYL